MHLSAIGRLALLKEFYGKIIIPPAVWKEVVEEGMGRIEVTDVKQARQDRWVEVVSPTDKPLILVEYTPQLAGGTLVLGFQGGV